MPQNSVNWETDWDVDVGLWRSCGGGHTRPVADLECVHSGPNAANRVLLAAQVDQIDHIDATGILRRLRQMQEVDGGSQHGCLRWYWEEDRPVDTNAAFFTGLSLIVLWKVYRSRLSGEQRDTLLPILEDLSVWFEGAVEERSWYYPNKFLGDLVCAWLLHEIGRSDFPDGGPKSPAPVLLEAADYWLNDGWGWGEHLSDVYSAVCLDELSVLLLLSDALPQDVRRSYKQLFDDLLGIEDAFAKGPRVPALRSYAFQNCPTHTHYRESVKPLPSEIDIRGYGNRALLGHTFHHLDWDELVLPRRPVRSDVTVECFDGVKACARIEDDIRLGSVRRFPLMPSIEHFTHGLAWQSMPVALARPGKTWAYLQWETSEDGRVCSHPAEDKKAAYLGNALSEAVHPPLIGWTWARQHGTALMALRIMPALSTSWDRLTDRLRVIGDPGENAVRTEKEGWHQLLLRWAGREVSIHCLPLSSPAEPTIRWPELDGDAECVDWGLTGSREELEGKRLTATLWAISLDGEIETPPELKKTRIEPAVPRAAGEQGWELDWQWPAHHWKLRIDPLGDEPLKDKRKQQDQVDGSGMQIRTWRAWGPLHLLT